jgi:hypothetical protein
MKNRNFKKITRNRIDNTEMNIYPKSFFKLLTNNWLCECSVNEEISENQNTDKNQKKRIKTISSNAYGPTRFLFRQKKSKISHACVPLSQLGNWFS